MMPTQEQQDAMEARDLIGVAPACPKCGHPMTAIPSRGVWMCISPMICACVLTDEEATRDA